MKQKQLKNYLKLRILLFWIPLLFLTCQQDDLESNQDVQILIPKGKSYAKINTGNDVSGNVVDFLKEKTNNTLGVIIGTDNVRLSINDVAYRTSALGTVDTSKEVVVINETNTKHTFKVDNPNDTSNTVTNIIVVENDSDTYEYFLKYNFDDGIPYNEDGTVDLSRFTGTIDAYDSTGQRTGGISISNGEVIDNDGQTTPCPDDTPPPPDNEDDDDNNNQNGGGAQGNIGDGSPDDDVDGNQGGGGWFDGGPDWNPCTISYHRECTNGYSGEHEPTPINSDGDLCSGTLNGAGILVVTDCNGNVLGSGRYMNRTGEDNTINPCGGTTGVLLDDDEQCESFDPELITSIDIGIAGMTQSELESLIEEDESTLLTKDDYKNRIQSIAQYFTNTNNEAFTPIRHAFVNAVNDPVLSLSDLGYMWDKAKAVYEILKPHGFQLTTIGDIDNLDEILTVQELFTVENNSLAVSSLPSLKELYNNYWPQNAEEWSEFGEFLLTTLQELVPELIPGVAEVIALKNSIEAFNMGEYTSGATELGLALVGFFPVGKVLKSLAKIAKGFKVVVRMTKSFRKAKSMVNAIANGNPTLALNKFKEIGCQVGNTSSIRTLTNASEAQGKSYFDLLSKNKISETIQNTPNGQVISRTMPDNSVISFRNFAGSGSPNTNATIQFSGGNYNSNTINKLKFDN